MANDEVTVVTLSNGSVVLTIHVTKINDMLVNNNSVRFTTPFQSDPKASFYNLKRIDEKLTISGYLDDSSSSYAGDNTARKVMYRFRSFVRTEDHLTLTWGKSGGVVGTNTLSIKGFITKADIQEIPRDTSYESSKGTSGEFKIIFTFAEGESMNS